VGAQIKNFNAQAQIAQPKFLIDKTQKIKSEKRSANYTKKKSVKRKRNFFQKN